MNNYIYRNSKKGVINEEENMFSNESPKQVELNREFRMELKGRIMTEFDQKKSRFSFLSFPVSRLSGVISAFVLLMVGVSIIPNMFSSSQKTEQQNGINQEEVLKNLMVNNPHRLFGSRVNAAMLNNAASAESGDQSLNYGVSTGIGSGMIWQETPEFTYTKQIITSGPANNKCGDYAKYLLLNNVVTESYTYINPDTNQYYYLYVTKTLNGDLLSYSLSMDSETLDYYGGSYAVRIKYPSTPAVMTDFGLESDDIQNIQPGSIDEDEFIELKMKLEDELGITLPDNITTEDIDNVVSEYLTPVEYSTESIDVNDAASYYGFADDTQTIKVTEDGRELLLTTYTNNYFCGAISAPISRSVQNDTNTTQTKWLVWADPDTYQTVKEEVYYESVSPENLIQKTEYTMESGDRPYNEVEQYFDFPYSVEIREVFVPEYKFDPEQELSGIESQLKAGSLNVLLPTSSLISMQWFDVSYPMDYSNEPEIYAHMQDRAFYVPGEIGDKLFESYSQVSIPIEEDGGYIVPKVMISYAKEYLSGQSTEDDAYLDVTIDIYEAGLSSQSVFDSRYSEEWGMGIEAKGTVNAIIEGQVIVADKYQISYGPMEKVYPHEGDSGSVDPLVQYELDCGGDCYQPMQTVYVFSYNGAVVVVQINTQADVETDDLLVFRKYDTSDVSDLKSLMGIVRTVRVYSNDVMLQALP